MMTNVENQLRFSRSASSVRIKCNDFICKNTSRKNIRDKRALNTQIVNINALFTCLVLKYSRTTKREMLADGVFRRWVRRLRH